MIHLPVNAGKAASSWTASDGEHLIAGAALTISEVASQGPSARSYVDRVAAGDLDRDTWDEFVWHLGTDGDRLLKAYELRDSAYSEVGSRTFSYRDSIDLVMGSLTGERLRVVNPRIAFRTGSTRWWR